ncbi:MAG: hypothetical protein U0835_25540 [Isosphaeraceae bacterium]
MPNPAPRLVYCVLSARSLPYADVCLRSLFARSVEPLRVTLVTDGPDDADALTSAVGAMAVDPRHSWRVVGKAEVDRLADDQYAALPHLRAFRDGHPCWRKITDPHLLASPGEEMVLIDPDVYFPNRFAFEPTPAAGLLLMYQKPNCLHPPETVRAAFDAGVPMADHTDIGVCQATHPLDAEWLDWLVGRLGGRDLPWSMHVESVVWAALAARAGGGYLNPEAWFCWHKTLRNRVRMKRRDPGAAILASERGRLSRAKCFHAGGPPKAWLAEAEAAGVLASDRLLDAPTPVLPYVLYTRARFERKHLVRGLARKAGFYKVLGEN